jgi:NhaA family Na+:H+ antiporter
MTATSKRPAHHHHGVRPSWIRSERAFPRAVVRPALRLAEVEAAGAVVMVVAAVVALVWANSPWHAAYETFLDTPVRAALGSLVEVDLTLHGVVNDGLMTLFFLLAGLEIKRQLVTGELRDPRAAALPAIAALGGMVVPAAIYFAFNAGHPGSGGWGIPVATDIAFAVGVVTLAGERIGIGARIFILTLAVVDDVGGIIVIALFYANDVNLGWLAFSAGCVALTVVVRRVEIRSLAPYVVLGAACWYGLHEAGVEAAIAGVIFGLLTPTDAFHDRTYRVDAANQLIARLDNDETTVDEVARYLLETEAPLTRIEQRLNLWVAFVVVPLFALVNAGVRIDLDSVDTRVTLGVALGLVVGKTVGVSLGAYTAVRLGLGRLPDATTWRHIIGLAVTAGIGFTVALYIAGLSFTDDTLAASAKLGIIIGSVCAGTLGYALLRSAPPPRRSAIDVTGPRAVDRAAAATG